ncbi:MAG TPA: peptidylprolyl isomerase [Gemmatimonadales bacterium]|nr:peptidylprolyl isomerase [Gemmatimonadales bacterium]
MKVLREPLFHFLLLGGAIFGGYGILSRDNAPAAGKIVVTQGRIEALTAAFTRTWQRPPTASERDELIQDYIREEVYNREAISLGLDRDDVIIRRRLRQKLEFASEDVTAQVEPTDDQLRAYLIAHPDAFRVEPRFTFSQVFFNSERRGEHLRRDAVRLAAQLRQVGTAPDTLGDSFLLGPSFDSVPAGVVAAQFGEQFVAILGRLPIGQWQGPVASVYGAHLVFVSERTEGRLPALGEVRDAVRREWAEAQRVEASEKFYRAMLRRYTVTIERTQT